MEAGIHSDALSFQNCNAGNVNFQILKQRLAHATLSLFLAHALWKEECCAQQLQIREAN
jgi:hypothetical protein